MTIILDKVTFGYREPILKEFSLTIPDEGIFCFSGPSGCGKTTLFHMLAGLMKPQSGSIIGIEHKKIALTFQEDRLFPWLTAAENIAVASTNTAAEEYLQKLGLEEAAQQYPAQLSGGMRRRIAIARSLAYQGDLLLLDEPFQGLDTENKLRLIPLIKAAAPLILVITHDREELALFTEEENVYFFNGPPLLAINSLRSDESPENHISEQ